MPRSTSRTRSTTNRRQLRPPRRAQDATTARRRIRISRVYAPPGEGDGTRILVDRLWPRGIAKAAAHVDLWLPDVAPSTAVRRRLHAAPPGTSGPWRRFVADYTRELEQEPAHSAALSLLQHLARGPITLLYATRDEAHNNAVALGAWLAAHAKRRRGR
jgi:uncharacterized protein YeaO (DUF488 family)